MLDVTLRPMPCTEIELMLAGRRPAVGVDHGALAPCWHAQYPLTETLIAVRMLLEAHGAGAAERRGGLGGRSRDEVPAWWIHQIVVDAVVVGDAGFHGPPAAGSCVVEIGYAVVPALRRRGIGAQACRLLVERAWRDGADMVVADTEPDNVASRRVLLGAGFSFRPDGGYALQRPAPR